MQVWTGKRRPALSLNALTPLAVYRTTTEPSKTLKGVEEKTVWRESEGQAAEAEVEEAFDNMQLGQGHRAYSTVTEADYGSEGERGEDEVQKGKGCTTSM